MVSALRMTQAAFDAHQARVRRSTMPSALRRTSDWGRVPTGARKSRHGPVIAGNRPSDPLPAMLANQCRAAGLPQPLTEYPFAKGIGRKFRADCFFQGAGLIVEVQGAVHRIAGRFKADRERSQVIAIMGYRLMLVSPAEVRDGTAVELVRRALCWPIKGI